MDCAVSGWRGGFKAIGPAIQDMDFAVTMAGRRSLKSGD